MEAIIGTFTKYGNMLFEGTVNTLIISFSAGLIGIFIGFFVTMAKLSKGKFWSPGVNFLADTYLSIIRGTPAVLQITLLYFVLLSNIENKILVASIAMGINSGAYIAEIIRAGILSVDGGQVEASRSLGMSGAMTMGYIVLPQAMKNSLPPLINEFIVLIKETAIVGFIGATDLMKTVSIIQSKTYDTHFTSLFVAGIIYWVITFVLTKVFNIVERRLRESDKR